MLLVEVSKEQIMVMVVLVLVADIPPTLAVQVVVQELLAKEIMEAVEQVVVLLVEEAEAVVLVEMVPELLVLVVVRVVVVVTVVVQVLVVLDYQMTLELVLLYSMLEAAEAVVEILLEIVENLPVVTVAVETQALHPA
jgi:hypothetical protein